MGKITKIFALGKTQAEVDFVDIDVDRDTPLFIDPHFLAHRYDAWSQRALIYVRSYFQQLVDFLKEDEVEAAREIFSYLTEPNETCLGLSTDKPRGRSVNKTDIEAIFNSLVKSKAVKSGLVEDLEDTIIFVDGVGRDKLSDITTNIIRELLIEYTQTQCDVWGIPLSGPVPSGFYWNPKFNRWESKEDKMLVVRDQKILLVPKGIVSFCKDYTPQEYHQHFVLNFLKNEQLRLKTGLVKTRVNKKKKTVTEYVTKEDVKKKISPGDKLDLREFTAKNLQVFKDFKANNEKAGISLTNEKLSKIETEDVAIYLRDKLTALLPGRETADEYEKLICGILELLFYPDLICPQKQVKIHNGQKRIDITFDNAASKGSLFEFHQTHKIPCQYIMVECKNYNKDPNNPELDQLSGRFSPNRGKVGLLVFRKVDKMNEMIQRCANTYKDDRGLIIPISDADLIEGLNLVAQGGGIRTMDSILRTKSRIVQFG